MDGTSVPSRERQPLGQDEIDAANPNTARIYLPSADEVRAIVGEQGTASTDPHALPGFVEEVVLPEPSPVSDVHLLQDWVTISARQGALVAQDVSQHLDIADYQDIALWVEVSQFTEAQVFVVETSPVPIDGWFRSIATINLSSTGIHFRIARWSSDGTPPSRWLRWRLGNLFNDWSTTFRVTVQGLRSTRVFRTQPPDWITQGQPAPPRHIVRVVRPERWQPSLVDEPGDNEQVIDYMDEGELDAAAPPSESTARPGCLRDRVQKALDARRE